MSALTDFLEGYLILLAFTVFEESRTLAGGTAVVALQESEIASCERAEGRWW